jgi:hypothetical protein
MLWHAFLYLRLRFSSLILFCLVVSSDFSYQIISIERVFPVNNLCKLELFYNKYR